MSASDANSEKGACMIEVRADEYYFWRLSYDGKHKYHADLTTSMHLPHINSTNWDI